MIDTALHAACITDAHLPLGIPLLGTSLRPLASNKLVSIITFIWLDFTLIKLNCIFFSIFVYFSTLCINVQAVCRGKSRERE